MEQTNPMGEFFPESWEEAMLVMEVLNSGSYDTPKGEVREFVMEKIKALRESKKESKIVGSVTFTYKHGDLLEFHNTIEVPKLNSGDLVGVSRVAVEEVVDRVVELGIIRE